MASAVWIAALQALLCCYVSETAVFIPVESVQLHLLLASAQTDLSIVIPSNHV